jgi:phosphopantothenate synthetase
MQDSVNTNAPFGNSFRNFSVPIFDGEKLTFHQICELMDFENAMQPKFREILYRYSEQYQKAKDSLSHAPAQSILSNGKDSAWIPARKGLVALVGREIYPVEFVFSRSEEGGSYPCSVIVYHGRYVVADDLTGIFRGLDTVVRP